MTTVQSPFDNYFAMRNPFATFDWIQSSSQETQIPKSDIICEGILQYFDHYTETLCVPRHYVATKDRLIECLVNSYLLMN